MHKLKDKPVDHLSQETISGVQNNIVGVKSELESISLQFKDIIMKTVNSSMSILFWQDEWVEGGKLKDRFLGLYLIKGEKDVQWLKELSCMGLNVTGVVMSMELVYHRSQPISWLLDCSPQALLVMGRGAGWTLVTNLQLVQCGLYQQNSIMPSFTIALSGLSQPRLKS